MTAPPWIADAYDAARAEHVTERGDSFTSDQLATALIKRLPIEAMVTEFTAFPNSGRSREEATSIVARVARVLSDDDPEVVQLAELYQGASKALDDAGVPYAGRLRCVWCKPAGTGVDTCEQGGKCVNCGGSGKTDEMPLVIADRIRWLVQQRPIRAELESAQVNRKIAEDMATKYMAERDQLRKMYDGAVIDLNNARASAEEEKKLAAEDVLRLSERDAARDDLSRMRAKPRSWRADQRTITDDELVTVADGARTPHDGGRAMIADDIVRSIAREHQHPRERGVAGDALIALADLATERERALDHWKNVMRRSPLLGPAGPELTEATAALMRAEDKLRDAIGYSSETDHAQMIDLNNARASTEKERGGEASDPAPIYWTRVTSDNYPQTYEHRVPGGVVILVRETHGGGSMATMVFVPEGAPPGGPYR